MPSLISPPVLGAVALALVLFRLVLTAVRSPVRSIPGPWHSRFTQAVLKYHTMRGRRMYYVDGLHRKYGPIVRIAPDEAAVSGLPATQMIHKVGSGFLKSPFYEEVTRAQRRDREPGIFSMRGGKPHAARRRLFARPFSQNSLQADWEPMIQKKARLAVNKIRDEAGAEGEVDILKWWTLMASDVIAHLSFGESFGMLELGQVCFVKRTSPTSGDHRVS
jgi:cytochrome P450